MVPSAGGIEPGRGDTEAQHNHRAGSAWIVDRVLCIDIPCHPGACQQYISSIIATMPPSTVISKLWFITSSCAETGVVSILDPAAAACLRLRVKHGISKHTQTDTAVTA